MIAQEIFKNANGLPRSDTSDRPDETTFENVVSRFGYNGYSMLAA